MELFFVEPLEQIKVAEGSSDVKEELEEDPLIGRKTQWWGDYKAKFYVYFFNSRVSLKVGSAILLLGMNDTI